MAALVRRGHGHVVRAFEGAVGIRKVGDLVYVVTGNGVGQVDAHPCFRTAVLIDGAPHQQRCFLEPAATAIHPQMVRRAVVGDKHVDAAVRIEARRPRLPRHPPPTTRDI